MRKKICFFMLFFSIALFANAQKLVKFSDFLEADYITASDNKLFVSADNSIYIYSLKGMKLIKKVGRKGEGPEEFQYSPRIRIYNKKLYAYSLKRLSVIDMNGKFLKTIRLKGLWNFKISPIKENFVLLHFSMIKEKNKHKTALSITLWNNKMEKIKNLYSLPQNMRKSINIVADRIDFDVWNNKIFISDSSKGLFTTVFDSTGKKINKFKNDYKKIKISESYKKEKIDRLKKRMPKGVKPDISCSDYFPSFHKFYIFNGYLYFKTYEQKGDKVLFRIFDKKGKEMKKVFLPNQDIFTINNNIYYYLKRDKNDDWELYSVKI